MTNCCESMRQLIFKQGGSPSWWQPLLQAVIPFFPATVFIIAYISSRASVGVRGVLSDHLTSINLLPPIGPSTLTVTTARILMSIVTSEKQSTLGSTYLLPHGAFIFGPDSQSITSWQPATERTYARSVYNHRTISSHKYLCRCNPCTVALGKPTSLVITLVDPHMSRVKCLSYL